MLVINGEVQGVTKVKGGRTVMYRTPDALKESAGIYLETGFEVDTTEGRQVIEYYTKKVNKTNKSGPYEVRTPTHIAIESGALMVPATQPDLIAFLDRYIEHAGPTALIYKEDLAQLAQDRVDAEKDMFDAKALIIGDRALDGASLKEVAKSYGYKDDFAEPQQYQHFLLQMAKTRPKEFLQRVGNASTKVRAMLQDAVTARLIIFQEKAWYYIDENGKRGNKLKSVREGSDALLVLSGWIMEEENETDKEILEQHVKLWRLANGGGTEAAALEAEQRITKRGNPNFGKKA